MKSLLDKETLTLFFKGEINSSTSLDVEKDALAEINGKEFKALVLDFEEVTYVSSAGLRIVLKLKQQFNNVSIVNASLEVYDVLNMTGFTTIMEISKSLVKDIFQSFIVLIKTQLLKSLKGQKMSKTSKENSILLNRLSF